MFIAALFTTAKIWKQPNCPSTDEWIKKIWYIHKTEYYLAIKRMKSCHVPQHGWVGLQDIKLSETSQRMINSI